MKTVALPETMTWPAVALEAMVFTPRMLYISSRVTFGLDHLVLHTLIAVGSSVQVSTSLQHHCVRESQPISSKLVETMIKDDLPSSLPHRI